MHFKSKLLKLAYEAEVESSRTSLASRTHFEVLGLEASSPWPWPRSLTSSKIVLSPAREQHYFFEPLKFCWKTPETSPKICKYLFCFPQLEHRLSQAGLPPNRNFTNEKIWQKSLLFLQFQFLFSVFRFTSSEQQY